LVGRREEKRSLKTHDPAEAKRRHLEALAEVEAQWENLRAGPRAITEREAHDLATIAHDRWLEMHRDNPSEQTLWPTNLGERVFAPPPPIDWNTPISTTLNFEIDPDDVKISELEKWCFQHADELAKVRGLVLDENSRAKLAKAFAAAIQRASLTLERQARGNHSPDSIWVLGSGGEIGSQRAVSRSPKPVKFDELIAGWASEKRPVAKTLYEWKRVVGQLKAFLGHDDAARLRAEDLIAWKGKMIEAGLRAKTVRDAKFAPVRAILQWAVDNRRLAANPADRLVMSLKAKAGESRRSFTEDEAAIVLGAALGEADPVRRWVPWLGAYSGARVSEICQLRVEDILEIDAIWCMKFDPGAGSLKTRSSERVVPLHPALIEGGFLKFVAKSKPGPLFPKLPPDVFGNRGGNGTKVIGRWVRGLGLTDERISPSHSWRHRFKTLGRRHGLMPDIVNAITGHHRKTVADTYGEFPIEALYRELLKLPLIRIEHDLSSDLQTNSTPRSQPRPQAGNRRPRPARAALSRRE
jgi:integrase